MSVADSLENLKNFDINDLDFNNAGSWPILIKLIVLVIFMCAIVFGGYWFLIKDQYTALDKVVAEEKILKEKYEQKAFKVSNLDAYKAQMIEMEKSFGALLEQLPQDTEVPGLLEDITNTGLGSGLVIESIKLKKEVSKGFYVELPMDIRVSGSYHDMASFVSGVAALPRIVTLGDFSLTKNKIDSTQLGMSIAAKTYRYQSETEAKKSRKKKKGGKRK